MGSKKKREWGIEGQIYSNFGLWIFLPQNGTIQCRKLLAEHGN